MTLRRTLVTLALLLGLAAPSGAQLGLVPHTFAPDTDILSAEVNTNFSTAYANALNRTGGTMTGLLTSQQITPAATNTYSLGSTGTRFQDLFLSRDAIIGRDVSLAGALSDLDSEVNVADQFIITSTTSPQLRVRYDGSNLLTLSVSSSGAATFDMTGAGQAFTFSDPLSVTGNLTVSGTATATTFSGSGASLTSIPETAITDGSLLARVGGTETISGAWTFTSLTNTLSSVGPILKFVETDATVDEGRWLIAASTDTFVIAARNDAENVQTNVISVSRTGTVIDVVNLHGAQVGHNDGLVGAPGITFIGDPDSGLYRIGANNIGLAVGGIEAIELSTTAGNTNLLPGMDTSGGAGGQLGSTAFRWNQLVLSSGSLSTSGIKFYSSLGTQVDISFVSGTLFFSPTGSFVNFLGAPIGTRGYILEEIATSNETLSSGTEAHIYVKGDNLVFRFNDGGTPRYKYIPLSGTSVTWTYSATEP